jgi:hypothetical protein
MYTGLSAIVGAASIASGWRIHLKPSSCFCKTACTPAELKLHLLGDSNNTVISLSEYIVKAGGISDVFRTR